MSVAAEESLAPHALLLSPSAAIASREAFATLSAALAKPNHADNSFESMVREMLRPLLKEWLDARLPALVQARVAHEIARLHGPEAITPPGIDFRLRD